MRKSKLMAVIIILFLFTVSGFVNAQDSSRSDKVIKYKNTPIEQATKMADKMKKHLKLTDEQYNKISTLFADNITYKRDLRTKDLISKSEIKTKNKEFREGIKSTLTKEQFKKFNKMMRKKHSKHRKHQW
jgi:Spy/CpxP family protein refolding chaperone